MKVSVVELAWELATTSKFSQDESGMYGLFLRFRLLNSSRTTHPYAAVRSSTFSTPGTLYRSDRYVASRFEVAQSDESPVVALPRSKFLVRVLPRPTKYSISLGSVSWYHPCLGRINADRSCASYKISEQMNE